ncbi:MAG: hypothetical protein OJF49_001750 [Ktedonobacterales bacterium]|nr:MAG: hypothetical protein OJF49_001750 [Ktedonobacterales bacterium]
MFAPHRAQRPGMPSQHNRGHTRARSPRIHPSPSRAARPHPLVSTLSDPPMRGI